MDLDSRDKLVICDDNVIKNVFGAGANVIKNVWSEPGQGLISGIVVRAPSKSLILARELMKGEAKTCKIEVKLQKDVDVLYIPM